jgi:hypothetical protein
MNIAEQFDRSYAFARVVGAKGGCPIQIAIAIDPRVIADPTAQLIAMSLCNLVPRVTERYTNVDLSISDDQETTIPRQRKGSLLLLLQETLRGACLCGSFEEVGSSNKTYDYCFVIGEKCDVQARCTIYVWASGWRCFASKRRSLRRPLLGTSVNPFSAVAAASIGSMILYHDAEGLNERFHSDEINGWSLFDYCLSDDDGPVLPASIDVGHVIQAGLGGTAQALLWTLRHGPELRGEWHGFEHEMLDISNSNRYSFMKPTDAGSKATLALDRFGSVHPELDFRVTEGRVESIVGGLLDSKLVLATVDDPQVRVALQNRGAEVTLNVGTNSQWLSISRHELRLIREGGPCVECFYGSNEQAPRRMRESTVSFVVALVGAVLGGELVKSYSFPENVLANSWVANVFAPGEGRTWLRPPSPNCRTCSVIRS